MATAMAQPQLKPLRSRATNLQPAKSVGMPSSSRPTRPPRPGGGDGSTAEASHNARAVTIPSHRNPGSRLRTGGDSTTEAPRRVRTVTGPSPHNLHTRPRSGLLDPISASFPKPTRIAGSQARSEEVAAIILRRDSAISLSALSKLPGPNSPPTQPARFASAHGKAMSTLPGRSSVPKSRLPLPRKRESCAPSPKPSRSPTPQQYPRSSDVRTAVAAPVQPHTSATLVDIPAAPSDASSSIRLPDEVISGRRTSHVKFGEERSLASEEPAEATPREPRGRKASSETRDAAPRNDAVVKVSRSCSRGRAAMNKMGGLLRILDRRPRSTQIPPVPAPRPSAKSTRHSTTGVSRAATPARIPTPTLRTPSPTINATSDEGQSTDTTSQTRQSRKMLAADTEAVDSRIRRLSKSLVDSAQSTSSDVHKHRLLLISQALLDTLQQTRAACTAATQAQIAAFQAQAAADQALMSYKMSRTALNTLQRRATREFMRGASRPR